MPVTIPASALLPFLSGPYTVREGKGRVVAEPWKAKAAVMESDPLSVGDQSGAVDAGWNFAVRVQDIPSGRELRPGCVVDPTATTPRLFVRSVLRVGDVFNARCSAKERAL